MKSNYYGAPFALFGLQAQATMMAMEAGAVIWMRTLGAVGAWAVTPGENDRMISEKQKAFYDAGSALMLGAMRGQDAEKTLSQALRPIRRTTRSNVRRLTKRGPTKG